MLIIVVSGITERISHVHQLHNDSDHLSIHVHHISGRIQNNSKDETTIINRERWVHHTFIGSDVNPVDVGCVKEWVVTQTIMQIRNSQQHSRQHQSSTCRETYRGLGHRATEAHSNWPGWFKTN